jgi:hypothetical protein
MDTRIHRFICTFQSPEAHCRQFTRATLSECGSWTYAAAGNNVVVWRTDTGLIAAEFSSASLKSWEVQREIGCVAFHPHDHIIAFTRMGHKQTVDLYVFDETAKPLGLKKVYNSYIDNR